MAESIRYVDTVYVVGGSIDDAMSSWLMNNGGISNKYCNDNRSMDV